MNKNKIVFVLLFLVIFCCFSPKLLYSYDFDPIEIQIINGRFDELANIYHTQNGDKFKELYNKIKTFDLYDIGSYYMEPEILNTDFSNSIKRKFNITNDIDIFAIQIKLCYFIVLAYYCNVGDPEGGSYYAFLEGLSDDLLIKLSFCIASENKLGGSRYLLDIINWIGYMWGAIRRG